jgi:Tfp pilus assembly protein PilO
MSKRITLYAAAALAMTLVWYYAYYSPTSAQRADLGREIQKVEAQLADFNRTIEELPAFLAANKNLELLRGELNSSLFAKSDILELFWQLNRDATAHGLELVEISPPVAELLELNRRAPNEHVPQFLNITLRLEGEYVSLGRFVRQLEAKPYFRSINSCIVRGTQMVQPTVNLSVSFKALIGTVEESA